MCEGATVELTGPNCKVRNLKYYEALDIWPFVAGWVDWEQQIDTIDAAVLLI